MTTMSDKLTVRTEDHTLVMAFNRPEKKNAVDIDMLSALSAAYTRLDQDPALRVGVLYGEGSVFTAGLDLASALPRMAAEGPSAFLAEGHVDPFGLFAAPCKKPVIVGVHGRCYTAGLELTLAADMCVAAAGTVFGQMEVRRGIFPFGGATLRLPEAIGWHNAMRYMLAGDTFSAEEGVQMGLVQVLAAEGEHLQQALSVAQRVADNAPLAIQACLANARLAKSEGSAAAVVDIQETGRVIAMTEDAREGVLSLVEKRAPRFSGN